VRKELRCAAAYASKIVEKCGLSECNARQTPLENRLKLSVQSEEAAVDKTLYRSLVGSLRYLVNTRPDLGYAVGYVSVSWKIQEKITWLR
jgi:hypothetical protein